jgi:hypothetical protein
VPGFARLCRDALGERLGAFEAFAQRRQNLPPYVLACGWRKLAQPVRADPPGFVFIAESSTPRSGENPLNKSWKGKTCRTIIFASRLRPDTPALELRAARNGGAVASSLFITSFERSPMSYAAAPIFFFMALVTYFQAPQMCTVSGNFGYLGTMWLMYVIMGVVHSGPWWSLACAPLARTRQKERKPRELA